MMKALIVEDERMAQAQLVRLLKTHFPDIEVVQITDSVRNNRAAIELISAVTWIYFQTSECIDFHSVFRAKAKF